MPFKFLTKAHSIMDQETQEEIERLNRVVDEFSIEMKARLREQAIKGCRGWDDPASYQQITESGNYSTLFYSIPSQFYKLCTKVQLCLYSRQLF